MNTGKRVMRSDSVPYNLKEIIGAAENSASRKAKEKCSVKDARQRMIDRMGKSVQQPLTPGRAYELFTAGSGAEEARQCMLDRRRR